MLETNQTYSDFVISRAVENTDLASWIGGLIEMQGLTITLQDEFYQHKDFLRLIGEAMRAQTRVIALLSNEFLGNDDCLQEAIEVIRDDPLNNNRRLLMFRIDDCKATGHLANIPFTDLAPVLQQQDARGVAEIVLRTIGTEVARLDYMPPLPKGNHLVKSTILHPQIRENRLFTGRKDLLLRLSGELRPQPGEVTLISNSQEVAEGDTGLAGVGKSTLAREFGWQNRNDYEGAWWISANSRSSIIQGLIDLGERLSPPIRAIESREAAANMVIEAFETRDFDKPWLLIYDDVDQPRTIEGLLPRGGAQILMTTRWSDLYGYRNKLDVGEFSSELAVWYLCNLAGENDPEAASRISGLLGHHPLSLSIAGHYCRSEQISLLEYIDRFKEEMRQRPRLREKPWKHSDGLYVAFNLSLQTVIEGRAEQNLAPMPLAGIMLGVMAYMAPEHIPLDLFQIVLTSFPGNLSASATACPLSQRRFDSHASRSITPYTPDGAHGQNIFSIDPAALSKVVMALVAKGLLQQLELQGGKPGLSLHWLVQEMMRARLAEQGQDEAMAGIATGLLTEAFPSGGSEERDPEHAAAWPRCAQLLPHTMALFEHIPANSELAKPTRQQQKAGMGGREIAILLNQSGLYLKARGDHDEAEPLLRRALDINKATYGERHVVVAVSLNNLAAVLQGKGWLFEAEPLYMDALKIDEAQQGRNHPNVARDLFNLGLLYGQMGREGDVEPLFHRALQINVKKFGRSHPNVAIILNSLGRLYEMTDQTADAEPLYRRALEIDEAHYGKKHPYVARDCEALAKLMKLLDRYEEAGQLFRRVLALDERFLGPDHPDIAANLGNFAVLVEDDKQDFELSERLKRRALAIDEAAFGPGHPNVARDLNNLAMLLKNTGRLREAEPMMRRVIDIFEDSLGKDHQNVATVLNNLADLLRESDRYEEAEAMYRRAMKIDEQHFGLEHHAMARDYNNLALLLKIDGRPQEAEPYARRALKILEDSLPAGHPWIGRSRSNLAAIQADIDSLRDPVMLQPVAVSEFDLAVLGEQTHQTDGESLWQLFDEEASERNQQRNPLKTKLLDKLLRRKEYD